MLCYLIVLLLNGYFDFHLQKQLQADNVTIYDSEEKKMLS